MHRLRRRRYAVLLLLLLAFMMIFTLTACNSTKVEETPSPSPVPSTPQPTPEVTPTPDPYPSCTCAPPAGELAPHNSAAPAYISSVTPADTLVIGTASLSRELMPGSSRNSNDSTVSALTNGYRDIYWIDSEGRILLNDSVVCNAVIEYDDDFNLTYVFTLHNYLRWSNGDVITADDYIAGILTYTSPVFISSDGLRSGGNLGYGIIGLDAYQYGVTESSGQLLDDEGNPVYDEDGISVMIDVTGEPSPYLQGVQKLDEMCFSVTLSADTLPDFFRNSRLTFRPLYIHDVFADNEIISDENGVRFKEPADDAIEAFLSAPTHTYAVTCGPYVLVSADDESIEQSAEQSVEQSQSQSQSQSIEQSVEQSPVQSIYFEKNTFFGVCPEGYIPFFDFITLAEMPQDEGMQKLRDGEIDIYLNADMSGIDVDTDLFVVPVNPEPASEPDPDNNDRAGTDPDSSDRDNTDLPLPETEPEPVRVINISDYTRAGYGFLQYSLDTEPVEDKNVRIAISALLDRTVLIGEAFGGNAEIIDGVYSPAQWVYKQRENYLINAAMIGFQRQSETVVANSYLDLTPWVYESDGETPFDIEKTAADGSYLRHNADGQALSITIATASPGVAEALEAAFEESAPLAGVDVVIELTDGKTLLDYYYFGSELPAEERTWHAIHLALDFAPAHDFFWDYHSTLADTYLNASGLQDEDIDALVINMRNLEPDETDEYADLWVELQSSLLKFHISNPLYANKYFDAYNTIVTQVPVTGYAAFSNVVMHIAKHG